MLKLSRVAPHEWEFEYPRTNRSLVEEFNQGCELNEEGNPDEAAKIFKAVLAQVPDHLDAIHHLAVVRQRPEQAGQARDLWEQAVRIGRKAFPPDFEPGRDRLKWGWLDNRPFLRCLHGLGLARFNEGKVEKALQLFREIISLNPDDNLGARVMALEALFILGRPEDVLKVTAKYPDDALPETLYGRALALFKLGRRREADTALNEAVRYLPLVKRELLKKRHRLPRTAQPGFITQGGSDEAYCYWGRWRRFWEEDPEAREWLKGATGSTESRVAGVDRNHYGERNEIPAGEIAKIREHLVAYCGPDTGGRAGI